MKVTYTTLSGFQSTAYLDDEEIPMATYKGIDKHTDNPLQVYWNDVTGTWYEVTGGRNVGGEQE